MSAERAAGGHQRQPENLFSIQYDPVLPNLKPPKTPKFGCTLLKENTLKTALTIL